MASELALSSSLTLKPSLLRIPTASAIQYFCPARTGINHFRIHAKLGESEAEPKKDDKKKFITKEEEPEQYWQTAGERAGENPMATPLPYIIIFGMSTPFIILAVAFANGWIKVPIR